jgi:hypothetical protein
MLLDDIGAYLDAQLSSLSIGSTGNLFLVPIPETAPTPSAWIVEYAGLPSLRAMGANAGSPIAENVRFQILVRADQASFSAGRTLAQNIVNTLDHIGNTQLVTGGTRYLYIRALGQPSYLGEDANARHRWNCNFEAAKERST